ncbi:MAG: M14 family zinc carboxypeptidase [Syntrophales bacterium]|nr:M14 family zinc carboxypeptidase [Syntrophales bacterium]
MRTAKQALFIVMVFFLYLPPATLASNAIHGESFVQLLKNKAENYGWKDLRFSNLPWESHRRSNGGHPLVFVRLGEGSKSCVLFLGGVHGDETPTVYLTFALAQYLWEHPEMIRGKCVVIAPLVNPDGFFSHPMTRVNGRGVDINRNFPTRNWRREAHKYWRTKVKSIPRYYPGDRPASEPETLFQMALINRFKPNKILSVHSPLNFFDYDGPSTDLNSFEKWLKKIASEANHPLRKFGYYPGSLGNYAGNERGIFTVTLELPSSNPGEANKYFQRFQKVFMKFIDLPVRGIPPHAHCENPGS